MDIKEYIASGILEQYVLGLLSPEEGQEVEQYVQQYPELRTELNEIEHALESYVSLNKAKVSSEFYQQLTEKLDQIKPDAAIDIAPNPPSFSPGTTNWLPGLLGAALIATIAIAAIFYRNYQQVLGSKQALQTEYDLLQNDCDKTTEMNRSLLETLKFMRQSGSSLIKMMGTAKAPAAIASVIWNPETQKAYLDVIDLPAPPSDMQYQLWAIVDGVPVDMGVFDVVLNGAALQEVPFIANPQAFAVTLEKRGGSPTPTLEEMVVVGNKVG